MKLLGVPRLISYSPSNSFIWISRVDTYLTEDGKLLVSTGLNSPYLIIMSLFFYNINYSIFPSLTSYFFSTTSESKYPCLQATNLSSRNPYNASSFVISIPVNGLYYIYYILFVLLTLIPLKEVGSTDSFIM